MGSSLRRLVDKVLVILAFAGVVVLFGAAGAVETAANFEQVHLLSRVLAGFGLMLPLSVKYLWKEYIG